MARTPLTTPAQGNTSWWNWANQISGDLESLATGVVSAAAAGVKNDGTTDNTATLTDLANTYQSLTKQTLIDLPGGNVRGHVPLAPGLVWRLNGTVLKFPTTGPTKHMFYPLDTTWSNGCRTGTTTLYGNEYVTGAGAHRCGIVGDGWIDGEASTWGISPTPPGPTPNISASAGTLAAAWYGYRLAYKTSFGIGKPGAPNNIQLASTGGAKLTWTNTNTTAQIVVYGRGPWGADAWQEMVTLPANTTTWTDDGSATLGNHHFEGDLSAPAGIFMTGAAYTIRGNIKIMNTPGMGLASRWEAEMPINEPATRQMEAVISGLYIENSGADGIVLHGPHDTHLERIFVVRPGARTAENDDRDGIYFGICGPYVLDRCHIWGYHGRGIVCTGYLDLLNIEVEGSLNVAVLLDDEARINGAKIFSPGGVATARGLVIGNSGWTPVVSCDALYLYGYSAASGAALDVTYAGAGSRFYGMIRQSGGTPIAGSTAGLNFSVPVVAP